MAVYAILMEQTHADFGVKIREAYPDSAHYRINDQQWLVSADKLVKDIGDELGMSGGTFGRVVIFRIQSPYWGWHNKRLWEWLDLKLAAT